VTKIIKSVINDIYISKTQNDSDNPDLSLSNISNFLVNNSYIGSPTLNEEIDKNNKQLESKYDNKLNQQSQTFNRRFTSLNEKFNSTHSKVDK